MYYQILVASQRYHGNEALTYSCDKTLTIGQIVQVPLGKIKVLGIVCATVSKPSFAAKPVALSWNIVVPKTTIDLLWWLYTYYPAALGTITELFTPPAMTKKLGDYESTLSNATQHGNLPPLTTQQNHAIDQIRLASRRSALLHGDTGTGKTRVYLELALEAVRNNKSVLITTPEIGLTEPLVNQFTAVFGSRVIATHSSMTPAKRRQQWLSAAGSNDPVVVIGPRSAIFLPIQDIGLIVIDEAHDPAYKQDQSPYYQTTRVAAKLRELHDALLVLGTATPLVTDNYGFTLKHLPVVRMTTMAVSAVSERLDIIVDARDRSQFSRSAHISNQLLDHIAAAISRKEQSLLFLNKRGSARTVLCQFCGWRAHCPRCDTGLTFHADTHNMRCHSCDYRDRVPTNCPVCNSGDVLFTSIGTKALAEEVHKHFPGASVARFDGDTHASQSIQTLFDQLHDGSIDIIVGTQAVAKGFDLPKLSVVGVVQADASLSIPDFTAQERTFQLLSQVSGRVGRGHGNSTLVIQTHSPDSALIKQALRKDYAAFYADELTDRQKYNFPPFVHVMTITTSRATSKSAESACLGIKHQLSMTVSGLSIDGPSPRFPEKIANKYAWHLVVKAKSRQKLLDAIKHLPSGCIPNLDPNDLL